MNAITFAICTRNRSTLLLQAIQSIMAQAGSGDELIVVDNGSTDATQKTISELARQDARVRLLHETKTGLSHARNLALREACGEWVIFIDDDAEALPGWFDAYEKFFQSSDSANAKCAGGPVTPFYDITPPRWLRADTNHHFGIGKYGIMPPGDAPWGCNYAVRRNAALATNGFNPALGHSGSKLGAAEETELADRLRRAGGEVWWLPGAGVKHLVVADRLTLGWQWRNAYGQGRCRAINRLHARQKKNYIFARLAIAPFHITLNLLVALVYLPFQHGQPSVKAMRRAASACGLASELGRQLFCHPAA